MRTTAVTRATRSRWKAVATACWCVSIAGAQWVNTPAKSIPRLPNGKPNLSVPAPTKPDLTGTWMVPRTTLGEGGPPRYATYLAADLPEGQVPLKPAARALIRERLDGFGKDLPFSRCLPAGVPMATMFPAPFKIIQNRGVTVILYETLGAYRQIFTDRRTLPRDPNPAWMGYSIGHWERDVFVVESSGFNAKTWLDAIGHPHGEGLRVTERFRRRDFGHIDLHVTIDDPEWYEKPWTVPVVLEMTPDTELLEDVCLENERDAKHLIGK
jgi:hypothetical protein